MAALIRCSLHIDVDKLTEDEFHKAWAQVKFYLETINQVKFSE